MKRKSIVSLVLVVLVVLLLFVLSALFLPLQHKKTPPIKAPKRVGQIAIVIDDWGYSLNNLSILAQIKQPLTCAILPGLKNSNLIMQKIDALGFEILLHLPMEPKEKMNLENNTLLLGMDKVTIERIFQQDLSNISLAKGISNHMGSRIAEEINTSRLIMEEVKKRKLYFFDSFVTHRSVYPALAKKIKVRFAKRDVFLDNQNDAEYIKKQLIKLKQLAKTKGIAVGIGHDRKSTLLVLKEMLGQLEKEGYEFVFLSQVVK